MVDGFLSPSVHAATHPNLAAVVLGGSGETTTYAQLEERSRRFANALRARGVGVGDHIAILLENNCAFLEVAWAAQRAGLHYTAVNSHLLAAEVEYILSDSGAKALVSSPAMSRILNALDLRGIPVRVITGCSLAGFEPYQDLLAEASDAPVEDEQEGREMLYSSGTTGQPKGVLKPLPGTRF
ncbi:MAG: AMP-binding protein, partial [Acidimicrobiia bacterium]|nr:AMP-binding protein [Acidimicrobiia bacterium]